MLCFRCSGTGKASIRFEVVMNSMMKNSSRFLSRYIGDKDFYRRVMAILLPIIVQNAISTFVSLLDNIMVGRIGTEEMTGVTIANQLFFVYQLAVFGGLSGVGIFTVQYFGSRDTEGIRRTFRYKLWLGVIMTFVGICVFLFFKGALIDLYLSEDDRVLDLALIRESSASYLNIILLSFPAFIALQLYASTLRECEETRVPMYAGIISVTVNLILNYLLIFGKFGFPELRARGAAIATVIARYTECAVVCIWTHRHTDKQPWASRLYTTLKVPFSDIKYFFPRGIPLLLNELLWSSGVTVCNQIYAMRGAQVISAQSIASNLTQFTNIIFLSMGSAVGIMVGKLLGAGETKKAKDTDNKLIAFGMALSLISAVLLLILSPLFPRIYNTSDDIRSLAAKMMLVTAAFVLQQSYLQTGYFTIRSGGRTLITFLFDSGSIWLLSVPTAFVLCKYTDMDIIGILICVSLADLIKAVIAYIMIRKNIWIRNIVSDEQRIAKEKKT